MGKRDIWAEWLAERRSGGNAEARRMMLEKLAGTRDRVLDGVLRPGGRIAIWEPINSFGLNERMRDAFWSFPGDGLTDLAERVRRVFEEIQPPDDPMLDFDERDLISFAEEAGFYPIELELKAEIRPTEPIAWHVFANRSGNPKIPTFAE